MMLPALVANCAGIRPDRVIFGGLSQLNIGEPHGYEVARLQTPYRNKSNAECYFKRL